MPKNFVDIETVVKNWAWRLYDRTATRKQKQLREKERKKNQSYINITIDWSDVKFRDSTEWSQLVDDDLTDQSQSEDGATKSSTAETSAVQKLKPSTTQNSDVCVLFQTKFTNNTKDAQEYTMRTEKTTKSSCMTEVENGFTKGFDLGVTLKAPGEVFEANAGYHREFSLSQVDGECFEEELTWGVESTIKVKAEHIAEAQLVVNERKQSGTFIVTTKLEGTVYVTFTNIRDNNSFLKATGGDISMIMEEYLKQERRKGESFEFVTIEDPVVTIKTEGSCKFRYGIKQEVKVDQRPLNNNV